MVNTITNLKLISAPMTSYCESPTLCWGGKTPGAEYLSSLTTQGSEHPCISLWHEYLLTDPNLSHDQLFSSVIYCWTLPYIYNTGATANPDSQPSTVSLAVATIQLGGKKPDRRGGGGEVVKKEEGYNFHHDTQPRHQHKPLILLIIMLNAIFLTCN